MEQTPAAPPALFDLLPETEQPWRDEPPARKYVLCSMPRCGSNLLGEYLRSTGIAGDPLELLNPRWMSSHARRSGAPIRDVGEYLRDMERRRTTPNGVFGVKIHFDQLEPFLKARPQLAADYLRGFDAVIVLRRRDKLAQAVSYFKASVTDTWSATERRKAEVPFDPVAITKMLHRLAHQEVSWVRLLRKLRKPYQPIYYEDTVADPAGAVQRVLAAVGISEVPEGLRTRIVKQSEEDDPMVVQFRKYLGVTLSP